MEEKEAPYHYEHTIRDRGDGAGPQKAILYYADQKQEARGSRDTGSRKRGT